MIRSLFLLLLLLATLPAHTAERPNIVLFLADDLGVNDIACYGRTEHRTPHLDTLAAAGMRFTAAYTAQPICSPSRAALMTGKHPARLHLTNFLPGRADAPSQKLLQPRIEGQLPLAEVTLAELLRDAGYATGLFGKWHLGGAAHGPREQGFQTVFTPPGNSQPNGDEGGKSEIAITTAAERFIEDNRDRPFFCYLPHHNPHIPINARPDLIEKNKSTFHPGYAAMIEMLDSAVGRILTRLETLGLTQRTIVVFTSDNGGLHVLEFPGTPATHHGSLRAGKGYLYEGGTREPLIIRWPGTIPPGTLCDAPILLTDLVPTLLRAAGIQPDKTVGPLDGVDITPLLQGGTLPERPLYWHFPHYTNQGGRPASAIRLGDWKLIEHLEDQTHELYNLRTDPSELTNLTAVHPERTRDLANRLATWRTSIGAQMPSPNPAFDPALHRSLYLDRDPSRLQPGRTAAETEPAWKNWRAAMNAATRGAKPRTTPARGILTLPASTAIIHGEKLRYEPEPYKNTLGYWVRQQDWAEWTFELPTAGIYTLDILQGCGKGSAGAEVEFTLGGKSYRHTVIETGHFQHFIRIPLGQLTLPAGLHTLQVKPQSKPGPAVMDLREARLIPEEQP